MGLDFFVVLFLFLLTENPDIIRNRLLLQVDDFSIGFVDDVVVELCEIDARLLSDVCPIPALITVSGVPQSRARVAHECRAT